MKPRIVRVVLCENVILTSCKVTYESGAFRLHTWRTDAPEYETAASCVSPLPATVRDFMHSPDTAVQYKFHDSECGVPWRAWV